MSPRRPLAALAAASFVALAGCSDGPFAPIGPLAGETYVLSHVNGEPLPALVWGAPSGARQEIVGETIEFRPFWRVQRTRMLREVAADGAATTRTIAQDTHYRVRDATERSAPGLVLDLGSLFPCPPPALDARSAALSVACVSYERASASGDALELTSVAYGATSVTPLAMRFVRRDAGGIR